MIVVLLGPPGSGKGTQADAILARYNLPHISTGDMFRSAAAEGTPLGLKAKSFMDKGLLVPDDTTIGLVQERILKPDCEQGCLLDGFPRTIAQATALDLMLESLGRKIDCILYFDVDPQILVKRLSGRRICTKCDASYHILFQPPLQEGICDHCGAELYTRDDDKEETAHHRLEVFEMNTAPLVDFYLDQGRITDIDAAPSPKEVTVSVFAALDKLGLA